MPGEGLRAENARLRDVVEDLLSAISCCEKPHYVYVERTKVERAITKARKALA